MAKKRVRVELDEAGIIALLRSAEVQECVNGYADRAVERLGEGYEATHTVGKKRAKAKVTASAPTEETVCPVCGRWHPNCPHIKNALQEAMDSNSLIKALF